MTPMVDLGFLLITFFIFTTSLREPTVTKLAMPAKSDTPVDINKKWLLTALLDKDKVYVYEGIWQEALATGQLKQTGYDLQDGLGNFIREKQKTLEASGQKDKLMVAIKPLPRSSYQNLLNALDEMTINQVQRHGVMELTDEERGYFGLTKQP